MKNDPLFGIIWIVLMVGCGSNGKPLELTIQEEKLIKIEMQKEIDIVIQAVSNKDINAYMESMPEDFIIYDEKDEIITREKQREYALRDWSIIQQTLSNEMKIDSIDFISPDRAFVFTSQRWERLMYQRDGITIDTIITTQLHKELWKNNNGWAGYNVEELGGEIYINGQQYIPD